VTSAFAAYALYALGFWLLCGSLAMLIAKRPLSKKGRHRA